MKTKNTTLDFVSREIEINDSIEQMLDDYRHEQDAYFASLEEELDKDLLDKRLEMQVLLSSHSL